MNSHFDHERFIKFVSWAEEFLKTLETDSAHQEKAKQNTYIS